MLTITGVGRGTIGVDTSMSVTDTNAGTGTTNAADMSTPFASQVLTFAVGDSPMINSSNATLDVNDDRRLEGDETVNLTFVNSLSSTPSDQVSEGHASHPATIEYNETGVVDFQA